MKYIYIKIILFWLGYTYCTYVGPVSPELCIFPFKAPNNQIYTNCTKEIAEQILTKFE